MDGRQPSTMMALRPANRLKDTYARRMIFPGEEKSSVGEVSSAAAEVEVEAVRKLQVDVTGKVEDRKGGVMRKVKGGVESVAKDSGGV